MGWRDLLNGLISAIPVINNLVSTTAQSMGVQTYLRKIDKLRQVEIPTQAQLNEAQALYDEIVSKLGSYGSGRAKVIARKDAQKAKTRVDAATDKLNRISEAKSQAATEMYQAGSRPIHVFEAAIKENVK